MYLAWMGARVTSRALVTRPIWRAGHLADVISQYARAPRRLARAEHGRLNLDFCMCLMYMENDLRDTASLIQNTHPTHWKVIMTSILCK